MKKLTIKEAAREWVKEFNAIDQSMIRTLMEYDEFDWQEVTAPAVGDTVYIYDYECEGEVLSYSDDTYEIEIRNEQIIYVEKGDFELSLYDALPMWGTMWSFGDSLDNYWLEEKDSIQIMSDCGFRIFHHDEWGYFFGIDGAGYDFYEAHWIPLYLKRGLKWHDKEDEVNYEGF